MPCPKLSVVVPVYCSSSYLPHFFSLLSKQTFSDFRLIFVYDVSTDNSLEILSEYSLKPFFKDRLSILKKPVKEGVGKARDYFLDNFLIDCKYVLFLDCDDSFVPQFFEKMMDTAEKSNSDITICGFERVDEKTEKIISTEMVSNPTELTDLSKASIIPYLNPAPWNKLFRSSVIKDSRFVCPGGGEDEMFFLKVLPNCKKIAFINEPLYRYYLHANSLLSGTNKNFYEIAKSGYSNVKDFYVRHGRNYEPFLPIMEASVFIRFGIGMTTRTCLSLKKGRHAIIRESRVFFDRTLQGWKSNYFLSFKVSAQNGKKAILIWRCKILYIIRCFSLFVFEYRLFTKLFKKDIKW